MKHSMRHLSIAVSVSLVAAACHDNAPTAANPLPGGVPLTVDLQTVRNVPTSGLPRLTLRGGAGSIVAQWEVVEGLCMLASATAERAGSVVMIWIDRYGNPVANCTPAVVGSDYIATVTGLSAGVYQVEVVDQLGDGPGRRVGRATLAVARGP